MIKCTVIVSVYKDTASLDLILQALARQSVIPNEVIISEDCDSQEMLSYVALAKTKYPALNLNHLSQEDLGWRKNRALNRAVVSAENEYLIFIDGDCVPFDDFVENHLGKAQVGSALAGKRIELGPRMTKQVYEGTLSTSKIANNWFSYIPMLIKDKARHLEDIIHIKYNSFWSFLTNKEARSIIGCNWSVYKKDLLEINGFNEDYTLPSVGEDTDLVWRFKGLGITINSCRYNANIIHLFHEKRFNPDIQKTNREIMKKNQDLRQYVCINGINRWFDVIA